MVLQSGPNAVEKNIYWLIFLRGRAYIRQLMLAFLLLYLLFMSKIVQCLKSIKQMDIYSSNLECIKIELSLGNDLELGLN